jgi:hypothetical protein
MILLSLQGMFEMKRFAMIFCSLALVFSALGTASATPIYFDLADEAGGSSVIAVDSDTGWIVSGDITAELASDLGTQTFTLDDGESYTVDFFTLTVSGLSLLEDYTVAATLAFDDPAIGAAGSGGGTFFTFYGWLSGGTLTWDSNSLPDLFTVDGNTISVDFENGCIIGLGDTAMVHATIANLGGSSSQGVAPVPEPATLLLLGTGLAGLAAAGRRKAKKA